MTRKQRRGVLIGGCLAVLGIAVGLVLFAMRDSIVFFYSPSEVTRSPLLGEHTDEILRQVLGFSDHQVAEIHDSGALDPLRKQAAE